MGILNVGGLENSSGSSAHQKRVQGKSFCAAFWREACGKGLSHRTQSPFWVRTQEGRISMWVLAVVTKPDG